MGRQSVRLTGIAVAVASSCWMIAQPSKPRHPDQPTLLVMCDMVCNWKLDGQFQGRIGAGGGAKVKVEPGQHMVVVFADDGLDQITQECTVKSTGQTLVNIEFQPIRDARLTTEADAANRAQLEARAINEQKAQEAKEQKFAQEERARLDAERQPWTDLSTGLMWTKESSELVNWPDAVNYCRNLRAGNHDDWRLPTIDELLAIHSAYLKGKLSTDRADVTRLSLPAEKIAGGAWSSSQVLTKKGKVLSPSRVWSFGPTIDGWGRYGYDIDTTWCCSAWCVRQEIHP